MKKFRVFDDEYKRTWEVSLTFDSKAKEKDYEYTIHFRKVDGEGKTTVNPYWHHAYYASTLLESHCRGEGICLHGGGTYEDRISMGAKAFDQSINKVEKHLKGEYEYSDNIKEEK